MRIEAVDLFCGVGGLSYGVQQAGINVLAGIDIDESCEFAYTSNNFATFINKSVNEIDSNEIKSLYSENTTKMLMGCAPCQPFSSHQKNKFDRSSHKDWGLLYDFLEHIKNINPTIVSMENVPELVKETVFSDFVESLTEIGYFVNYQVVNAAEYGVPQRRRRLLLLASLHGEIDLIEPTHKSKPVTLRQAIGDLDPIKAGELNPKDPLHISSSLSKLNIQRIQASKPGGTWEDWPDELLLDCYRKESGKTYKAVYGRLSWEDVSSTLTTQFNRYGTGRYGHPEQDRALSFREGAIIQSFPKDYKFIKDQNFVRAKIARQIGNAVPVRLGEVIGLSIKSHINQYNKKDKEN